MLLSDLRDAHSFSLSDYDVELGERCLLSLDGGRAVQRRWRRRNRWLCSVAANEMLVKFLVSALWKKSSSDVCLRDFHLFSYGLVFYCSSAIMIVVGGVQPTKYPLFQAKATTTEHLFFQIWCRKSCHWKMTSYCCCCSFGKQEISLVKQTSSISFSHSFSSFLVITQQIPTQLMFFPLLLMLFWGYV